MIARLLRWLGCLALLVTCAPALANSAWFEQVEAKSGKPLGLEQRYQLSKAIKAYTDLQRDRDELLVGETARLTLLLPQQIFLLLQQGGSLVPRIEALLKRKLPAADAQQLRAAEAARKTALQAAREKLVSRMATLAGLSAPAVLEILPKFGL